MDNTVSKRQLGGLVGFSNLPNQVHRRSLKQGFNFNLMLVGESGLGKTTLLDSLFDAPVGTVAEQAYATQQVQQEPNQLKPTVEIKSHTVELEEQGVKLRLTVIDTPGYAIHINNKDCYKPIAEYVENRFAEYLEAEEKVHRDKVLVDNRVHAILHFIAPTGHCVKDLDLDMMSRVCKRTNIIPVIAKADSLSDEELIAFKQRVQQQLDNAGITYYKPEVHEGDDAELIEVTKGLVSKMPFAVIGSNQTIEINGKKVRARQYPWGVIPVESEQSSDFLALRTMLIRTHMEDVKETLQKMYETYRAEKMMEQGAKLDSARMESEVQAHQLKMQKMEQEMLAVFQQKVADKEAKLRASESELYTKHQEMSAQLRKQMQELEQRKASLKKGGSSGTSAPHGVPGSTGNVAEKKRKFALFT